MGPTTRRAASAGCQLLITIVVFPPSSKLSSTNQHALRSFNMYYNVFLRHRGSNGIASGADCHQPLAVAITGSVSPGHSGFMFF